jgi:hypothetical protein
MSYVICHIQHRWVGFNRYVSYRLGLIGTCHIDGLGLIQHMAYSIYIPVCSVDRVGLIGTCHIDGLDLIHVSHIERVGLIHTCMQCSSLSCSSDR